MNISNINDATSWFQVLLTTSRSQVAVMTLKPGAESGPHAEAHAQSDQTLLVVSGKLRGEVGAEKVSMGGGDAIIIPAGTPHRFWNEADVPAVTFNVYSPPEYAPGDKG